MLSVQIGESVRSSEDSPILGGRNMLTDTLRILTIKPPHFALLNLHRTLSGIA